MSTKSTKFGVQHAVQSTAVEKLLFCAGVCTICASWDICVLDMALETCHTSCLLDEVHPVNPDVMHGHPTLVLHTNCF